MVIINRLVMIMTKMRMLYLQNEHRVLSCKCNFMQCQ